MTHLDADRLVLLALGEDPPTSAESGHLDGCVMCRTEIEDTRTVVGLGRETASLQQLPSPSPAVWDAIAREALGQDPAANAAGRAEVPLPEPEPRVLPSPRRRPFARRAVLGLAAAACIALGAGGVLGVQTLVTRDDGTRVLARAELAPAPGAPATASGTAQVVDDGSGPRLEVALRGVPPTDGYYLVWLYDGQSVMIPLGTPGGGRLNLPASANLDLFRIVDISAQRMGQQEHGRSVLQGRLHA